MPAPLLSIHEVATLLNVSPKTIYHWQAKSRGPRPYRVGKFLRWDQAEVLAWLETTR